MSATEPANHVLVISLDEEMVKLAWEDGETFNPLDRDFWLIDIRCEANPDDLTRSCMTWWECLCPLTDEQHDKLADDGEGPCPKSPTGYHRPYIGGLSVAYPSRDCWAAVYDELSDVVYDLADKHALGPGSYRVHVTPDGEYLHLELTENGEIS